MRRAAQAQISSCPVNWFTLRSDREPLLLPSASSFSEGERHGQQIRASLQRRGSQAPGASSPCLDPRSRSGSFDGSGGFRDDAEAVEVPAGSADIERRTAEIPLRFSIRISWVCLEDKAALKVRVPEPPSSARPTTRHLSVPSTCGWPSKSKSGEGWAAYCAGPPSAGSGSCCMLIRKRSRSAFCRSC